MNVKVHIDPMLLHITGGQDIVKVEGENVAQCLDYLQTRFPGLKLQLFDNQGKLWSDTGIFLNNDSTYPHQPDKDAE